MPVTFERAPEEVLGDFYDAYVNEVDNAVYQIFMKYEKQVENFATANAPWHDITGNARQGLYANVDHAPRQYVSMIAGHGPVEYAIWLEIANAGRWAILLPTISYFEPRILADVRKALS